MIGRRKARTLPLRRAASRTTIALGVVLAIGVPLSAGAQSPGALPSYTPAHGAKDLKSVLFNWTWYMGMLRGIDEHEIVATLDYRGKGTIDVHGRPCKAAKYRQSINYQVSGERIRYACTLPDGHKYSNIEVVSGGYAWNENVPGAGITPGRGKVTPMPSAEQQRLIRLWASPQGAAKAALAGANQPDPRALPDNGSETIGKTSVAWKNGEPVVTFPIPGVPGAIAKATLDKNFRARRVVVTDGSKTVGFTYGNYRDWNDPLNRIGAFYAGKMVERDNGKVVRDITTVQTDTGNIYVVVPVPASIKKAIKVMHPVHVPIVPRQKTKGLMAAEHQPTPRMADGHPDLTGNWMYSGVNWRYGYRRCSPVEVECTRAWNQTIDYEFEAPSRYGPNRPLYKPKYWDKVQNLDDWTNKDDPVMTCQPLGIPREGPPSRIVQGADTGKMARDIIFFYRRYVDGGGGYGEYRIIPIDNRKRDPIKALEPTYMGYAIGHWEGDTLVLDSTSFIDATWLARGGFFHSDQMHVVERLTRKGNTIRYQVTVSDPKVLAKPWVMRPRMLMLNPNPDAGLLPERGNCSVPEIGNITSQIHH